METRDKSLSEQIQEKIYKDRIEELNKRIELWGGKSREELIKKANTRKLKK